MLPALSRWSKKLRCNEPMGAIVGLKKRAAILEKPDVFSDPFFGKVRWEKTRKDGGYFEGKRFFEPEKKKIDVVLYGSKKVGPTKNQAVIYKRIEKHYWKILKRLVVNSMDEKTWDFDLNEKNYLKILSIVGLTISEMEGEDDLCLMFLKPKNVKTSIGRMGFNIISELQDANQA